MNVRSGKPLGINTLLFTILFVTLLAYLAIWGWVIWQIWDGDSTDINAAAIYAGSAHRRNAKRLLRLHTRDPGRHGPAVRRSYPGDNGQVAHDVQRA